MARTLAEGLQSSAVEWETLHNNYNPLLNLVRELLGIIPNCDPLLEIWPPGFRTYNLLVPNMFNLPNTLFGSTSFKAAMGLAMYASSKAACAYCTAHACSFALRRGARPEVFAGTRTEKEQAVVTLAEGLARITSTLSIRDIEAVRRYFSASQTEWLVFAISMMGFLNKFMNAVGVELEQEAINDTAEILSATGWQPGIHASNGYSVTKAGVTKRDNLFTYLRVIRQAPGAVLWEKRWTRNVPSTYAAAGEYLQKHTSYPFPILRPVKESRVIQTLTTVLRDNLDAAASVTGLRMKMYAGTIFSSQVKNEILAEEIRNLAKHLTSEMDDLKYRQLAEIAKMEIPTNNDACEKVITALQQELSLKEKEAAIFLLAVTSSPSPAQLSDAIIETVLKHLEPAEIVETIVWLSVLQLLNRLSTYYKLVGAYQQ